MSKVKSLKYKVLNVLRALARQHVLGLLLGLSLTLVAAIYAGSIFLQNQKTEKIIQETISEVPAQIAPVPASPKQLDMKKRPRISIIIDDAGVDKHSTKRAIALPYPITLSFLPYADDVQAQVSAAKEKGHEVFLHFPMQASGHAYAGPDRLEVGMDEGMIRSTVEKILGSFDGYAGINNHMGSAFSADENGMRIFLSMMREKGLFYVDSRTTAQSAFDRLCGELNISCLRRDVFLDHVNTREAIHAKLDELVMLAEQKGYALAIGHPHQNTLDLLEEILPNLATRVDLVPVKKLLETK